jgi:hypothetical protein
MRDILDHRVEGKGGGADDTRIVVLDEPGQGGACHKYAVITKSAEYTQEGDARDDLEHMQIDGQWFDVLMRVEFQDGPIQEVGINGVQQEHLLAIVADRLRSFQAGPFSNRYNGIALTKTEEALMWLQRRTVDRIRRGVEGFNKA